MPKKTKPAAGGSRSAGSANSTRHNSSTAHRVTPLISALRWTRWTPAELVALDRRRRRLALRAAHLDQAVLAWESDRDACRYHAGGMVQIATATGGA